LTSSSKRILKVWLPSVIWIAIITLESTNLGSGAHTARLLNWIFHFLFGIKIARLSFWNNLLRKTGHVIGYAIMSALFFRSWRGTFPRLSTQWCLQWSTIAVLSTALVASLDEWHQSFLPSRTGAFRDVLLDTAAALAAQLILFAVLRSKSRNQREYIVEHR